MIGRIALVIAVWTLAVGRASAFNLETEPAASVPQTAESELSPFDELINTAKSTMMGDPGAALEAGRRAEALARQENASKQIAAALWIQSEALVRTNRAAEAKPYVEEALSILRSAQDSAKLRADLLLTRGRAGKVLGDYESALRSFQEAFAVFGEIEAPRSQAIALQNIGSLYNDAHDYDRVLEYYANASAVFSDDPALDMSSHNNRGNALRQLGRFDDALDHFRSALTLSAAFKSPLLEARILSNIASTQLHQGELQGATESVDRGLALIPDGDPSGWSKFLYGIKAEIALERGDNQSARSFIENTFPVDPKDSAGFAATVTAPYRDFHETAYRIWSESGAFERAARHLEAFKTLDDRGRDLAASANTALLGAEFDFANKELEIEKLRADKLEQDIELAQSRERERLTIAGGVAVLGLSSALFLAWAYSTARRTQKITQSLNTELATKNSALEDSNDKLEKANKAKSAFLAATSHEIRTPLNAINGFAEVLLAGDVLRPQEREYVQMIDDAGKNLIGIVSNILDISRLESDSMPINLGLVYLEESVEDVCDYWREQAEEKGLSFAVELPDAGCEYETDDRLFRQILNNLLSNAIKFTADGSVTVRLLTDGDGGPTVVVEDTGTGVPLELQKEIFEIFRQADESLGRQYEGAGLGLAICKKIARALKGDITLSSTAGEGATFTLDLPHQTSRPEEDEGEPELAEAS